MEQMYLVTGAAGHLGTALVKELTTHRKQVRALVLPGEGHVPPEKLELFYGDVRDIRTLDAFFTVPPDTEVTVIHAAGIVSIASKFEQRVMDVNVGGTKNVVQMCLERRVKKLVYVSSVHAIPTQQGKSVLTEIDHFDPDTVSGLYAKTKAMASQVVMDAAEQGLNASIVHPSGIMGPYDYGRSHLTALVSDYMKGGLSSCIKGGYDFVDVRDVAKGIVSCCDKGQKGECYILSNEYFPIVDILRTLHDITGHHEIKRILPSWFVRFTAPMAEMYYKVLGKPPLFTSYFIEVLENDDHFDHTKATRELDYNPRPMEETLRDMLAWLKQTKRIQ